MNRDAGKFWWLVQAFSGVALVLLLGMHFIAQHYVAQGGLRTYADVVAYLASPWVLALETLFLVVVAVHAALGLRAVALDLGLARGQQRLVDGAVAGFALAVVFYGLWLFTRIGGG